MKAIRVFLPILLLGCSAQLLDLGPDDYRIESTDKKNEIWLVEKIDTPEREAQISRLQIGIHSVPISSEDGNYSVIIGFDVMTNQYITNREIRVGSTRNEVVRKYGVGEKAHIDDQEALQYRLTDYKYEKEGEIYPFIDSFLLTFLFENDRVKEMRFSIDYEY